MTKVLPSGTNNTWTFTKVDVINGLVVFGDDDGTEELRSDFAHFLTCMATHCPANILYTVMNESTSYDWILNMLNKPFNLQTKGEHFLHGNDPCHIGPIVVNRREQG